MTALTVSADVTGTVWKIVVDVGDKVSQDQDLVILESMKMEIPACAPTAGVVLRILVEQGEAVKEGCGLVVIEPT
jgi:biotin carboxyl carrier protein